jgi:uncharacterized tellurite resistance protein B-like protein
MINRIKALLDGGGDARLGARGDHSIDELHLAAAALLVEAARMDDHFGEAEWVTVHALLRSRFDLSKEETDALLEAADREVAGSVEIYRFARLVKDSFDHGERVELIEMLWEVVYADDVLHDHEANLLRRVAGLIYVSDRESGQARKRVLGRRGRNPGGGEE